MSDTCPPINAEWLARMTSTKPELLCTLFGMFLADEPKRLADLADAIAKGDHELARYHAHSLKGAAAVMGMDRLRDACRALEVATKETPSRAPVVTEALDMVLREAETVFGIMRLHVPQA